MPGRRVVDVKTRVNILMETWHTIIEMWEESSGSLTRQDIARLLSDIYKKEGVRPIKGASNPQDLYDKELSSLYVVGKYGMGLDEEYPELFDKVFIEEYKYENAISIILNEPPENARERVRILLGRALDDNTLARILRLKMTQVFFGFDKDEAFQRLIIKLREVFPEKEKVISNYAKFYAAFKIAEAISRGEVRDKITKEALKHALALELGLSKKKMPDDDYIKTIAVEVFSANPKILNSILTVKKTKSKPARRTESKSSSDSRDSPKVSLS